MIDRMARLGLGLGTALACAALLVGCPEDAVDMPDVPDTVEDIAIDGVDASDGDPDARTPDIEPELPPIEPGEGLGIDWNAAPAGAALQFAPESDAWRSVGWPSDRYRDAETGALDLSQFPNPNGEPLLDTFVVAGETEIDGFGLNTAVYFAFDADLDPATLPDAAASLDPMGAIQLVNATPGSDRYGEQIPLVIDWRGPDIAYYGARTLVMRPVFGFPLAEGETYCALVTRELNDADGNYLSPTSAFETAMAGGDAPGSEWVAPLKAWTFESSPLRVEDLAGGTCFTTQHATDDLRNIAQWIADTPPPTVDSVIEPVLHGEFRGTYLTPNLQEGEMPYANDGGGFVFNGDIPVVQLEEPARFLMLTPHTPAPEDGWPVVLYAHGTGGDYESCRGRSDLVALGYVMLCIDQPFHGSRGAHLNLSYTELILDSFNFLNPSSGRATFRQSVVDTLVLAAMVRGGRFDIEGAQTIGGIPVRLDPARVTFFGHSHGGLSGAMAVAVDPTIKLAVLSGAAGIMIETILRRKDPVDISSLVALLMGIEEKDMDTLHPVLNLVQLLVEATDPVNYAPFWLAPDAASIPRHIFVTQGTADHASPSTGADAMVAAARLPQLGLIAKSNEALTLAKIAPQALPVSENLATADGPRTGGVKQFQGGSHFVAFQSAEAGALWWTFFKSYAQTGIPVIGTGDTSVYQEQNVQAGDGCADAAEVDMGLLPAFINGDTTQTSDTFTVGSCAGDSTGAGGRDAVIHFKVDATGDYRIGLGSPPNPDKDTTRPRPNRFIVTTECAPSPTECLSNPSDSAWYGTLQEGQDIWVIVDGSGPEYRGAFWVEVDRTCEIAECGERVCGAWGCGNCGDCGVGSACSPEGQCDAFATAGDTCTDAVEIGALPYAFAANSRNYGNDYQAHGDQCPGMNGAHGINAPDIAFRFTAPVADTYDFNLDAAFGGALYVADDCGDIAGTCRGGQRIGGGGEHVQLAMETGETVYMVADGWGDSTSAGAITVRVDACAPSCDDQECGGDGCGGSCGECGEDAVCASSVDCGPIEADCDTTSECQVLAAGDRCVDPLTVDSIPFIGKGSTEGFEDDYAYGSNQCAGESGGYGGGSGDAVYAYTPTESARHLIKVSGNYDMNVYIATNCGDIGGTCIGAAEDQKTKKTESLYVDLEADTPYWIVVDGKSGSAAAGSYTLDVSTCAAACTDKVCGNDGCGGSCGSCAAGETCGSGQCTPGLGSSCAAPRIVSSKLPWSFKGAPTGYGDSYGELCNNTGTGSEDMVFRFIPPSDGIFELSVSGGDSAMAFLDGCPDPGNDDAVCISGENMLTLEAKKGEGPYWIIVDGADGAALGTFTFAVSKLCTPECEGKDCGDDGCSGSCGSCAIPTDYCDGDQKCVALSAFEGATCDSALAIGALPFVADGDTSEGLNSLGTGDDWCAGWTGKGVGGPEQVWRLDPTASGPIRISVATTGWDSAVYILGDCAHPATTCVGVGDGEPTDVATVQARVGTPLFIVVDSSDANTPDAGAYTLTVEALAP